MLVSFLNCKSRIFLFLKIKIRFKINKFFYELICYYKAQRINTAIVSGLFEKKIHYLKIISKLKNIFVFILKIFFSILFKS